MSRRTAFAATVLSSGTATGQIELTADPTATSLRTGEEGAEPGLAQDGAPATAGS
jgi:hypothetical protein